MWKVDAEPDGRTGMWSVSGPDGRKFLSAGGHADAVWLQEVLDDATNTVVKLYCMNPSCRGNASGEFITRPIGDTKKTAYQCDICKKPMGRRTPQSPSPVASEKQEVGQVVQPTVPTPPAQTGPSPARLRQEMLARMTGINLPAPAATPVQPIPSDSQPPAPGNQERWHPGANVAELLARMQQMEERAAMLEGKVSKLEADSVSQAETTQTLLQLLEGLAVSPGAQTT